MCIHFTVLLQTVLQLLTFGIGIGIDLPGKQSISPNASKKGALPKLHCSSTSDFTPNMSKFHHGTDHVYNCLI